MAVRRRLALATFGVVMGFVVAEVALRIAGGAGLRWASHDDRERLTMVDPVVGRIPRPNVSVRHPRGFSMRMEAHGVRSNGRQFEPPGPVTLVVGDSFAFGDEVDDAETFPSYLEQITGHRVVNGGVPGFGVDQSVLRAEQLADVFHPRDVIVSFIPHDIIRCEMSFWSGRAKPYFELWENGLRYHAAPYVPPLSAWQRFFAHSAVIDRLFTRQLHWDGPDRFVDRNGPAVACRLMDRLAQFQRERGAHVIVVAQPQQPDSTPEQTRSAAALLACASTAGLQTLDLFPPIAALDRPARIALFHGHMTARGNRLVAEALARALATSR